MEKQDSPKLGGEEAQEAPSLPGRVTMVLCEMAAPLCAVDIVKKLAEKGVTASVSDVNKALYNGAFDKVSELGKPTWKPRAVPDVHPRPEGMHTFTVDGVAVVSIPTAMPAESVQELLRSIHLIGKSFGGKCLLRAENTNAGRVLASQAERVGFEVGAPLPKDR